MIDPTHDFKTFFDQLGLPSDEASITQFLSDNHLPDNIPIYEASFWTKSQAAFIRQALADDADWAIVVDEISNLLRK